MTSNIIKIAEAYAPATVANLGVGFDILGLALSEPGDTVRAEWRDEPGVIVKTIEGDHGKLPRDAAKNTACVAGESVLRLAGVTHGASLTIIKGLPAASGLGSSAASAVAGAVAVNALIGAPLSKGELLSACLDGEAIASGYHPDNVAPSLFGGITLATGLKAEQIYQLPVPPNLHLALVTPDVEVPTALARAALPQDVPLKSMVIQTAAIAELIHALYIGDIEMLARAVEKDSIIEPARQHLMSQLHEARAAAKRAGALCLAISGAGPTLMAICDNADSARSVADALRDVYSEVGIASKVLATQVAHNGAHSVTA